MFARAVPLAAIIAALGAGSALAQPMAPTTFPSPNDPKSATASNIVTADTRSDIAPALPAPSIGDNAAPGRLLRQARQDLAANHTGAAQEALERAETRLLDRSVLASNVDRPDRQPAVRHVSGALASLGQNDINGATRHIDAALKMLEG